MSGFVDSILNLREVGDTAALASQILRLVETWREQLLFGLLVLECIPVVGFLAPGQLALAVAGFWASTQPFEMALRLVFVAIVAVLVADYAMFALGRFGTNRFGFVRRMLGRHAAFGRTLETQPPRLMLFYQFPPYSRMLAPFLLGANEMRWPVWVPLSLLGTLMFVGAFFMIGYGVGWSGREVVASTSIASTASALFALGFFGWLALFIRKWVRLSRLGAKHAE